MFKQTAEELKNNKLLPFSTTMYFEWFSFLNFYITCSFKKHLSYKHILKGEVGSSIIHSTFTPIVVIMLVNELLRKVKVQQLCIWLNNFSSLINKINVD